MSIPPKKRGRPKGSKNKPPKTYDPDTRREIKDPEIVLPPTGPKPPKPPKPPTGPKPPKPVFKGDPEIFDPSHGDVNPWVPDGDAWYEWRYRYKKYYGVDPM